MSNVKLQEIVQILSSKRVHLSDYVNEGIPFYRGKEIINLRNKETISDNLYIAYSHYNEIKEKYPVPEVGDILISAVGTIGVSYLVDHDNFYFKDGNIIWFRKFSNSICNHYFYYWLTSPYFLTQIQRNSIGAVQKALTIDMLKNLEIELPSLIEQKKIASILSILDSKIELNNKINQELEEMAKTLYDYWFVQFDFPTPDGKPYKSSGGNMVWSKELKREIPEGWEVKELSDIANITMGQSPSGSSYNEDGIGEIFFQGSTDFGWRFPTIRQYTTEPNRMAKAGDILLSVRAPVGTLNIASDDCCIGRGLAALNSKANYNSYLYYVMVYFKKIFDHRNSAGTTFGSITKDDLFSLKLVVGNDEVLRKYDDIVSKYNEKIFNNHKQNQKLTQLRDWLLPMLMNGQVKIK